ncbi:MAG: thymidine phosphorylase [Mycobacteriales bacterium]
MDAVELITTKRDGGRLSDEQISWLMRAYVDGTVPDEQVAALLMAIVWRGMTPDELATWTAEMIASGERLDLSSLERPTVDKHSTGGVGDKVSLILTPLIAAAGAAMPQLSGRGLAHTGGTLDKMESIPCWRALLSPEEFIQALRDVGGVICAAGPSLAPADRKLYALRDVTGTVPSIPLIAASIMSKKIAEGTESLVLDVKVGSGAFMKSVDEARVLAETMVGLGTAHGVRTTAFLTDMDTPLGRCAGNALEVTESVDVLRGGGPADLIEITVALAREMLALAGVDVDAAALLASGHALPSWQAIVAAQGGDPHAVLPVASERVVVPAARSGYLTRLDAYKIGVATWRLGAGRARKEDPVSATAGIVWHARPGDEVSEGQPLLELHVDDASRLASAREALDGAVDIGDSPPQLRPLVIERIS